MENSVETGYGKRRFKERLRMIPEKFRCVSRHSAFSIRPAPVARLCKREALGFSV